MMNLVSSLFICSLLVIHPSITHLEDRKIFKYLLDTFHGCKFSVESFIKNNDECVRMKKGSFNCPNRCNIYLNQIILQRKQKQNFAIKANIFQSTVA